MSAATMAGDNRLAVLAADIQEAHRAIQASAMEMAERAIAAGHALNEAKSLLPHGAWTDWLKVHAGVSERTARRYMQIARSGMKTATVADLGIRGATEALAQSLRHTALKDELAAAGGTDAATVAMTATMRSMGCRGIYGPKGASFPPDLTADEWLHIGRVLGGMSAGGDA